MRKTGSNKNWLKPAMIKIVLSMVQSLISNLLHLHYSTQTQSPLAVKGIVIAPRLTRKGQKVIPKGEFWLLDSQKPIWRLCWWK